MFALKKLLGTLLLPLPLASMLIVASLLARVAGWRRFSRITMWTAAMIAVGATLQPVSNGLLQPLELRHRALSDAAIITTSPSYIAVLGGGYQPSAGLPITAALSNGSVVRLTEAVRLHRLLPNARLITSGGAGERRPSSAVGYAIAAQALGVPAESIIVIKEPKDTGAEVRALRERIGDAPVLLVTSASHMPRAMALCARAGVRAIAAPTGDRTRKFSLWNVSNWVPSGSHLDDTETALHEYLGLLALSFGIT